MISVSETRDTQTCFALRHTVFVLEQGFSADGEVDAFDAKSHHLLATDNGTPIATARVYIVDDTAKIGRVCVLKARRGSGLGAQVITAAVAFARDKGAACAVLGAQSHAVEFYRKLGFVPYGSVYDDEGEPHQMMERAL